MLRIFSNQYVPSILLLGITLFSYKAHAQGLSIGTGAHVVVNGNANLQLNDANFKNDGSFVPSTGSVHVTGSSPAGSTLAGSATTTFNSLKVDRADGPLTLEQDIDVQNDVTMINGNIELNQKVLNLGTTGLLVGEKEDSRITGLLGGYIRSVATLNAPVAANPGNIGVEITSPVNMGVTELRRAHTPFDVSPSDESINRYFNIIPTNNNNLGATLKFHYFDAELNTPDESSLQIWSSTDEGLDWTLYGINSLDTVNNYAILGGIDTLKQMTLSTNIINDIPLGLTLLSFNAKLEGRQVLINWSTINEVATNYFDIERSDNGSSFAKIGSVNAMGNTVTNHSYNFVDDTPLAGMNYYRLKMVDEEGRFTYSRIALVTNEFAQRNQILNVFPNPAASYVNVRLVSARDLTSSVKIFNVSGSVVDMQTVSIKRGEQVINLPVDKFAAGAYYIRFDKPGWDDIKFVKE